MVLPGPIPAVLDNPSSLIVGSCPSIGAARSLGDDVSWRRLRCSGLINPWFHIIIILYYSGFFSFSGPPIEGCHVWGKERDTPQPLNNLYLSSFPPGTVGGLTISTSWTISSSDHCLSFISHWLSLIPILYTCFLPSSYSSIVWSFLYT